MSNFFLENNYCPNYVFQNPPKNDGYCIQWFEILMVSDIGWDQHGTHK